MGPVDAESQTAFPWHPAHAREKMGFLWDNDKHYLVIMLLRITGKMAINTLSSRLKKKKIGRLKGGAKNKYYLIF